MVCAFGVVCDGGCHCDAFLCCCFCLFFLVFFAGSVSSDDAIPSFASDGFAGQNTRSFRGSTIRASTFRSRGVCSVRDMGAVGLGSYVFGVEGAVGGVEARHEGSQTGNHACHEGDVERGLGPDVEVC